jgi:hypothetical protein
MVPAATSPAESTVARGGNTSTGTVGTDSSRPHPPSLGSLIGDDPPGPAFPARGSCTCRLVDNRLHACRKDDQNISGVTCFSAFFRTLLALYRREHGPQKTEIGVHTPSPLCHSAGSSYIADLDEQHSFLADGHVGRHSHPETYSWVSVRPKKPLAIWSSRSRVWEYDEAVWPPVFRRFSHVILSLAGDDPFG